MQQPSSLIDNAQQRLNSLPLEEYKEAGILRDRASYSLNIAYPSMQAMKSISSNDVFQQKVSRSNKKTVALYVHVPFCTSECYYCHYYKQFNRSPEQVNKYLDALEQELRIHKKRFCDIEAVSVYVGGGTPSYLNLDQIDRLFNIIKEYVTILPKAEISFEVHPESGDADKLELLKKHGVNRINIGVESFNDSLLDSENRRHTSDEAVETFERAKRLGLNNINLDLIYGLKDQTVFMWEETLNKISQLLPESATMYYLRLKRGTPEFKLWQKNPEAFPSDEDLLLMHAMTFEQMENNLHYIQNPVDWFIKDNSYFHSYQDFNWRRSDEIELLGIGASSYSYIDGWQYYNVNDVARYQDSLQKEELPIWRGEFLDESERMRRTIMLGIKMGIDRDLFCKTYQNDVGELFSTTWEKLRSLGLVEVTAHDISLTYAGKLFADEIGQLFYSDDMRKRMASIEPNMISTTWPNLNL
jgi:oxygen-independent coproporphyrinogen III oxidase